MTTDSTEVLLELGAIGSFVSLSLIILCIIYILASLLFAGGLNDVELSETSPIVMYRSGKRMLKFALSSLILFILPNLSYILLKNEWFFLNISRYNNDVEMANYCTLSWFLTYFGYELGKLFISILLIYRLYSSFDNTLYHIPRIYISYSFFISLPLLTILYIILIFIVLFNPNQIKVITQTNNYAYCQQLSASSVSYIMANIISIFREISFTVFIGYHFILRLYKMNKHSADVILMNKLNDLREKEIVSKYIDPTPNPDIDGKQTNQKQKPPVPVPPIQLDNLGDLLETQFQNNIVSVTPDVYDSDVTIDNISNKVELMMCDERFNMQNRRGLVIKYVLFISIMSISSFISQILLFIIEIPTFYISFDIIIHCICFMLILWISNNIWLVLIKIFYKICCCSLCCPILKNEIDLPVPPPLPKFSLSMRFSLSEV